VIAGNSRISQELVGFDKTFLYAILVLEDARFEEAVRVYLVDYAVSVHCMLPSEKRCRWKRGGGGGERR
jgi:hypothetical protein